MIGLGVQGFQVCAQIADQALPAAEVAPGHDGQAGGVQLVQPDCADQLLGLDAEGFVIRHGSRFHEV